MGHVPHLYLPGSWSDDRIPIDAGHQAHLERVLRRQNGDAVSYTDGAGTSGVGTLEDASVIRGDENLLERPAPRLTVAVAVPASKDRARFLVEKLGELGVDRIAWLETRHGKERPPRVTRATSWLISALEQSRGAWLTDITAEAVLLDELQGHVWFADAQGMAPGRPPSALTLVVGPEGGWAPGEIPDTATVVSLSDRVLRVETAAIVGAAKILS